MDKHQLFQQFVAFTTAVHQVKHEMTKDIKTGEITPVQYSILEYIAVSQPVTLSQISDCQHMSMPNTSREIRKLGEKRLCEKYTAEEDRRVQYIRLSPKGQAMMDEAFGHVESRFLEQVRGLSEAELEEVGRALNVLQSKVFLGE
ncbi:DNA-binding MarR family transcriptional regulator [Fontibacillus phaseoli]|uniref:DNA-binding MarR family transcriptional regulator n=1 Tax=Fontibacillus phaseoli TaxID=1416533 RepID=A0A369BDL5_9BACL|nr:MarR family winged helix-turn-helix transcriptional regulator [Fontibacillus phaseoli]RCX17764.1 DNA-binding MarR family transcriptional regulator [Fontibacillus phaseoli]